MQGNVHSTWSRDGALLLFDVHQGAGGTIWVQDSAAGSKPRQLTTEGHETGIGPTAWSPDSKQVAYVSRRTGTQDIWILDIASGQTRQLTNDIRDDNNPRWSPDGRMIAFLSDRGGQRDLWVMPSAGGDAVRLTNDPAIEDEPRWAIDGKSVYYSSTQNALEFQFVPLAGGPARRIHAWEEWDIGSARLSPDGKTIIYDSPRVGNGDVFALPAAGGEPVTVGSSPLNDNSPRFSPDGSQVALLSNRGGTYDIWTVPTSGGEARNVTASPGDEGEPVWSPDGSQIAFASSRDVGGSDLWVIASSGGTPRRLTRDNLRPASYQWSPDGRYLYFQGQRPGGRGDFDYFRVAATGGRLEPLGASPRIITSRLSRDGTQVVFATAERGWAFTHLMPATGGRSRQITTDTTNVYQPGAIWSMGDSLLVVSQLDLTGNRDNADILTYRLSDGRWTQLTRTVGNEDVYGITPDGNEILVALRTDKTQVRRVSVPPPE
jgi:Tol biopolymer transport system component